MDTCNHAETTIIENAVNDRFIKVCKHCGEVLREGSQKWRMGVDGERLKFGPEIYDQPEHEE